MFFDSHSHLNFKAFKNDYCQVIKRCQKNNVWMMNVGSQYETSKKAVEIAEKYEKGVYAAIGLHPIHVGDEDFDYKKYLDLAKSSEKVVAIGETGLDYKENPSTSLRENQKKVFLKHLELARELNKPAIIHCRETPRQNKFGTGRAHEDLIELLAKVSRRPSYNFSKGVIHCFTGNQQQAEKYLELGFYLGFTGIITYSSEYDDIIKTLPLEKILIETDSPYLSPVPHRGQRNEPLYVKYVAEKIATVRNTSIKTIAEQITSNSLKLFGIML